MKVFGNIIFISLICLPFLASSQNQQNGGNLSLDIGGGLNYSHGDINSLWAPTGHLGLRYSLSSDFGIQGNFGAGILKGGEDDFNRKFENQFFQYSFRGVFNISQITNMHQSIPNVNLLAYAGIGQMHNNSEDTRSDYPEGMAPRPDYTGTNMVYPIGGQLSFYLTDHLDFNLNVTYTHTNSDRIDNFAENTGSNRFNDGYSSYTIGLTYKFGNSETPHKDWAESNYDQQIKELRRTHQREIRALQQKVKELQAIIAANSLASWENETKLKRLEEGMNKAQTKEGLPEESKDKTGDDKSSAKKSGEKDAIYREGLSNKRFVTVLGSFRTEKRAKDLAKQLEEKGYNPGVLYNHSRGWYYVHVNKNEEIDQAREALQETRKELNIQDAWIYFRSADDLEKYRD